MITIKTVDLINDSEVKANALAIRLNTIDKIIEDAAKAEKDSNLTEADWIELEDSRTCFNRTLDL